MPGCTEATLTNESGLASLLGLSIKYESLSLEVSRDKCVRPHPLIARITHNQIAAHIWSVVVCLETVLTRELVLQNMTATRVARAGGMMGQL